MYNARFKNGYSPFSLARRLVEPKFAEKQRFIFQHLPYIGPYSDTILSMRDGSLMASLLVQGLNADTASETQIENATALFARSIQQSYGAVTFTVNRIISEDLPSIQASARDNFSGAVDRTWREHLTSGGIKRQWSMISVCIRSSAHDKILSFGKTDPAERAAVRSRLASDLDNIMRDLEAALASQRPERLNVSSGMWFGLIATLLDGIYHPIRSGPDLLPLATQLPEHEIQFEGPFFKVGLGETKQRYGVVLSLKGYPASTHAGMYDTLSPGVDICITDSFTPLSSTIALERTKRTRRQMKAAEDDAVSLANELQNAADDIASGRSTFGHHHKSIVLYADDRKLLERCIAIVRREGQRGNGTVILERLSAQPVYFAQHAGNHSYRSRQAIISAQNFSDMTAFHGTPPGRRDGSSPYGAPLTWFPTTGSEIYPVNLHRRSKGPDDLTPGHSLFMGRTGCGKTALMAHLLTQSARFGVRVMAFDYRNGLEMAIRAMGGSYTEVRKGVPTGFNPLISEADPRDTSWLVDWIAMLTHGDPEKLTPLQKKALTNACNEAAKVEKKLQRFSLFREFFRSVEDGSDLYHRMEEWVQGGRYAWLFDSSEEDLFASGSSVMGFDLTELFDNQVIRTAWLSYVFRRIERLVEDKRPTMIVLDEAWKFLDDPYFEKMIEDWMVTMRKQNCAVIMLTQLPQHLKRSAAGPAVIGSVATQILFPNDEAQKADYDQFPLTEGELNQLVSPNAERLALLRSGEDKLMLDLDLSALGGLLKILSGHESVKDADPNWRNNPDFWRNYVT